MMQDNRLQSGLFNHWQEALDTAPCGFLAFTDDGKLAWINTTLLQLLGYELAELQGRSLEMILPVASRIFYQTHFFPLLKLHDKVEEIYLSIQTKQKDILPILVNAVRRERDTRMMNECSVVLMRQRLRYEEEILVAKKTAEAAIQAEYQANAALQQAQIELKAKQIELLELNAHLEEQVQLRTAELQQALNFESLLRKISDKVRSSLDEGKILQIVVQELGSELKLDWCEINVNEIDLLHPTVTYLYQDGRITSQDQFQMNINLIDEQIVLGNLQLFRRSRDFNVLETRFIHQISSHCVVALRQSRLYQAAQAQVQELERLNQLKDDFLSTVSHELRTPLSSMKMALQMLEISLEKLGIFRHEIATIHRYFNILQEEQQRELRLINDLLDLARLDAEAEPLKLTTIRLQDYIPHLAEAFCDRFQQQEQHLIIRIPDHLPALTTDLAYFERIISELLQNACKYTPAQERVTLWAEAIDNGLRLGMTNTGVEISESEWERVFDKFYRIPNGDPWKHGGTGLGLALVRKLTERLGGHIIARSAAGATSFILDFTIPLAPIDQPIPTTFPRLAEFDVRADQGQAHLHLG
jgi:signal transduction histidine kinase